MTVLDAFGWAMTAAPYIPAFAVLSTLTAVVYGAWHTTRGWRERRAWQAAARRAASRRDQLETTAIRHLGQHLHTHPGDAIDGELDRHLDQYADSLSGLYERTEDR